MTTKSALPTRRPRPAKLPAVTPSRRALEMKAQKFIAASKSAGTLRAYGSDWEHFVSWCQAEALALPATPETVALYITALADTRRVSTITRRLAAISKAHQAAGLPSPCSLDHARVAEVLGGIKRELGTAPERKAPLLTVDLKRLLAKLPQSLLGMRDRALLLLGFAGAFRRAELVGLQVPDLAYSDDGLTVTLRRGKTDQEGAGRKVGIPWGSDPATCPIRAVRTWMKESEITEGPLFRNVDRHGKVAGRALTSQVVALVLKRWAGVAGLDPRVFAGHSLRAGMATQAAMSGASERSIMDQTGHRSVQMVRRYIREGSLFRENAAGKLGL